MHVSDSIKKSRQNKSKQHTEKKKTHKRSFQFFILSGVDGTQTPI